MLTGTAVNALAILFGTALGRTLFQRLPAAWHESAMKALGLVVVLIGISTALPSLSRWTIVIVLATAVGALVGEALRLEDRLQRLGARGEHAFGAVGRGAARAALSAVLIFCTGPLSILGPVQDGLGLSHATLYAKAVLDGLTSVALAATLGAGVALAALPLFVYQGAIAVASHVLGHGLSADTIEVMSGAGGALVSAIGLNMIGAARIRVASLLPALILAPLGAWLSTLL